MEKKSLNSLKYIRFLCHVWVFTPPPHNDTTFATPIHQLSWGRDEKVTNIIFSSVFNSSSLVDYRETS